MPRNPCSDFFAVNTQNREVVKELQKTSDPVAWEKFTASDHSPGPIADSEVLYRHITHPIHVDIATKKLKPTAFDDASNKGLSVERLAHKPLDKVLQSGRDRIAKQKAVSAAYGERELFAIAELHAKDIRSIVVENKKRALAIYDTAQCENVAHADVCQIVANKQSGRSARAQLIEAVKSLIEE